MSFLKEPPCTIFCNVSAMADCDVTYQKCYEAYKRQSNVNEVYDSLMQNIHLVELQTAQNVLIVGSGPAFLELKFLAQMTPNVKKVTFVEPNTSCFTKLKDNLVSGNFKVDFEAVTCKCTIQEWRSNGERFDLVLMSHIFYYFDAQERKELLKKAFDDWLNPGGLIFVTMIEDRNQASCFRDVLLLLGTTIDNKTINDIRNDVRAIGNRVYKEYPYAIKYNLDLFKEDELGFLQLWGEVNTTEEAVLSALEATRKDGFDGTSTECMCVLKEGY